LLGHIFATKSESKNGCVLLLLDILEHLSGGVICHPEAGKKGGRRRRRHRRRPGVCDIIISDTI
jgi:hypothetical protein